MANVCYKDALNEVRCDDHISRDNLIAFLKSLELYDDATINYTIRRLLDDGKIDQGYTMQGSDKIFYRPVGNIDDWLKNG